MAFSDDLDMNGTADADGIQAGDRSEHYFYAGWRLVETRDGSDNTLGQFGIHSRGRLCHMIDEPIAYDRNTDVTFGGSADDDCLDASGSQRYTYHQDANWRVVALSNASGAVVERYDYTAYGEPTIFRGESSEAGNALLVSTVGNPLMHQGLFRDDETGTYQNRFRQLHSRSGRFMQRDAVSPVSGYEYAGSLPIGYLDTLGLLPLDDDPAQTSQPATRPAWPDDVLLYNPKATGGNGRARGKDFAQDAQAFQDNSPTWRGLPQRYTHEITTSIIDTLDKTGFGDDQIATLRILDHGDDGKQGAGPYNTGLSPSNMPCDKLKDGAMVELQGCSVAAGGKEYLCRLAKACQKGPNPKNLTVCAYKDTTFSTPKGTTTCPAASQPLCVNSNDPDCNK